MAPRLQNWALASIDRATSALEPSRFGQVETGAAECKGSRVTLLRSVPIALFALVFALFACKEDDPTPNNGVNDVRGACLIRASWTAPRAPNCATCKAVVVGEDCGCEALKEFAGRCGAQERAKREEPSCAPSLDDCVRACGTDCECADGCYGAAAACKPLAAAVDGCVADVCAQWCTAEAGAPDGG